MINPKNVRAGDIMLVPYWVSVERVRRSGDSITVRHLHNSEPFDINGASLVAQCFSAGIGEKREEITRTEMVRKLLASKNLPFTVVFEKKDGSIRTLRGRLLDTENEFGRSTVHDFDAADGQPRQVDHRTLESLIVDNVHYTLKGK